ncbi:MAG: TRAP transporter substrate-binding protein [Kiloniellales bacterium]|nr:TRAP transporter substrate-binding protein [Kiloniellales bacterium]
MTSAKTKALLRARRLAGAGLLLGLVALTGGAAAQEAPLELKLGSAFPSKLPQLGTLGVSLTEKVGRISGGSLTLKFHEPNELMPPQDMFGAIAAGALDAAWSTPGYWFEREPALILFSGIPFGPTPGEYAAWIYYGGGEALMQEIYAKRNIHAMICGITVPEAAGWFRKEIKSVADLKGLKIRIRGLGARVLERLGAVPQVVDPAEIYEALRRGRIDATEYSMPMIDRDLGFHRVARYYYFPGWHQPSTLFELMLSRKVWEGLSESRRAQLALACGDNFREGLAQGEAGQFAAITDLEAKGVAIRNLPPEVLSALRSAWDAVAEEIASGDETFRNVYTSLQAFRRDYRLWKELGYLP